jgi:hypothetical protein
MQSMRICISCIGIRDGNTLAALREHQRRYPDRRLHYRRVLERVHNMRETRALMMHALAGRLRLTAWDEEDMLNIVHDNPSISTRHISSATGRLSQREAWRCIRFMYKCKGCSKGQTSPSTAFSISATQECTPLNFCAVARHEARSYATEVRVSGDLINGIQVTAACIVLFLTTISRQGLNLTSLWGVYSGGGWTLQAAVAIMYNAFSPLRIRHHTNRM